jgi:dCTP deaminase
MLTRKEIQQRMKSRELVITPLLEPDQIRPGGIDLRLGVVFIVAKHSRSSSLDPVELSKSHLSIESYQDRVYVPLGESLVLHPREMVLGTTLEYIVLPLDVAGVIEGRSSWGRLGLSIATAVKIHPGNKSCLTLELVNQGHTPIKLYPGTRIGHMTLHALSEPEIVCSRYDYAIGPQFSRLDQDPEISFLGVATTPTQSVIGVTGLINSGKSEVAQYLATRLGFVLKSPSMVLKRELLKRQLPSLSSEQKYQVKLQIRRDLGDEVFAARALQEALRDAPQGIVIDGLDHPAEVLYLQRLPRFHLMAVVAENDDVNWRWQRYNASLRMGGRDLKLQDFAAIDKRERESLDVDGTLNPHADHLDACIKMAEHVIKLGKDSLDIAAQIEKWIETQLRH